MDSLVHIFQQNTKAEQIQRWQFCHVSLLPNFWLISSVRICTECCPFYISLYTMCLNVFPHTEHGYSKFKLCIKFSEISFSRTSHCTTDCSPYAHFRHSRVVLTTEMETVQYLFTYSQPCVPESVLISSDLQWSSILVCLLWQSHQLNSTAAQNWQQSQSSLEIIQYRQCLQRHSAIVLPSNCEGTFVLERRQICREGKLQTQP
jgi:hypothetical protein